MYQVRIVIKTFRKIPTNNICDTEISSQSKKEKKKNCEGNYNCVSFFESYKDIENMKKIFNKHKLIL